MSYVYALSLLAYYILMFGCIVSKWFSYVIGFSYFQAVWPCTVHSFILNMFELSSMYKLTHNSKPHVTRKIEDFSMKIDYNNLTKHCLNALSISEPRVMFIDSNTFLK